ncbi:MAG: NAD(P)-dependent oxidoreductase [Pseudomonadales bacterium]|nr:NAD(P)-dependent oxidoreductase [Pseudomonadales bacterium]
MSQFNAAFIGLGTMGYPMAGHLAEAGIPMTVYNRTASRAQQWARDYNGQVAATPAEAAHGAAMVFVCVGNDDDLRQVTLGPDGALQNLAERAILVDHTTASAAMARELDTACRQRQADFIDAPVSGGQQGAENGQLSIMCGGDDAVFQRALPVLNHYAKAVNLMGPAGSGQLTKMVNQICVAGLVEALSEGVAFAQNAGLDAEKVFATISQGAASSWQMINRHKTMLEDHYDHGFAVDWMRKDLDICLEEAQRNGTPLPVTAQVNDFYRDIQAMGGGRWDTSSLLRRLKKSG